MPKLVLKSPAPRSLRARSGATVVPDLVHGCARLAAGAVEHAPEHEVRGDAEERNDEDGDRRADDALASVVSRDAPGDAIRGRAAEHVGEEQDVANHGWSP